MRVEELGTGDAKHASDAWELTREAALTQTEGPGSPHSRDGLPSKLRPGTSLGRYRVLDLLGRGGMGAVYRAYDPELDRIVAIKQVLMGGVSSSAQARLLREAQAIARLSHSHVVQVFDVGRDAERGGVFIAMEFVSGTTLKAWLRAEPRTYAQIAKVFVEAGEGLRAAHRQGLVHRDFKPDNVLIDAQGVAKVLDFGLAKGADLSLSQAQDTVVEGQPPRPFLDLDPERGEDDDYLRGVEKSSGSAPSASLDEFLPDDASPDVPGGVSHPSASASTSARRELVHLTRAGSRVGTPAYMPPEQIGGDASDGRADQFSFAVALYEALYEHLPFKGRSPEAYACSVLAGRVRTPDKSRGRAKAVPGAVHKALVRAMQVSPEARFPTLDPLLALLRDDPEKRRRRWMIVGAAAALGVGVSAGYAALRAPPPEDPCAHAGAAVTRSWDERERVRVTEALASLPRSFASDQATRIVGELDSLAARWSDASVSACRVEAHANSSAAKGADELVAVRRVCIDRSLARFRGLVEALATPTPEALTHASQAVGATTRELEGCADARTLQSMFEAGATRMSAQAKSDDSTLLRISQLQELGQYDTAARELAALGSIEGRDWPGAMTLRWGVLTAGQALAAGEPEHGRQQLELSRDLSMGEPAPLEAIDWMRSLNATLRYLGDTSAADRAAQRAFQLATERLGDTHRTTLAAMADLGHAPYDRGDYRIALETYQRAEVVARAVVPADDNLMLDLRSAIASSMAHLGRFDEAIGMHESVLEVRVRRQGESHPESIDAMHALAVAQLQAGRLHPAAESFERELGIMRRDLEVHSPIDEAGVIANLAATMLQLDRQSPAPGELAKAEGLLRGALARIEQSGGAPSDQAAIEALLGACLNRLERFDESERILQSAVQAMAAAERESSANGLMTRWNLAQALDGQGKRAAAKRELQRGLELARGADNSAMVERFAGALGAR